MAREATSSRGAVDLAFVGRAIDQMAVTPMLRYTLVVATLGYLFDSFDNQIVSYVLPVLVRDWKLHPSTIGQIGSAALWGSVVGAYAWGYISDRWGRVIAFASATLCFALLTGLTALATSVGMLLFLRFLAGIGLGGMVAIDGAFIAEYAPTRLRSQFIGAVPLAFPLGQFIATLVALIVIPHYGWRAIFVIGVLPAALTFAARMRVPESPRWLVSKGRPAEAVASLQRLGAPNPAADAPARVHTAPEPAVPPGSFWDLFAPAQLRDTAAVSIMWLANFPYWGFLIWVPTIFFSHYHFSLARSITYTLAATAAGFLGRVWSIWLINRFGRRPVIATFAVLTGLMALAFGSVRSEGALLGTAVLFQFFMDTAFLGINVYTPEVFPTRIRATGCGWAYGLGRILGAISPLFLGVILQRNLYGFVWILMCVLMLLAACGALLGRETQGQSLEQINEAADTGIAVIRPQEA
jgi:putative MFS transporter